MCPGLRRLTDEIVTGLYLISNPHANMLGLYYIPTSLIAHETGLKPEEAAKGLSRAIDAEFCAYDESSEMVFVREMARYQIADQLAPTDKQCAGIQREYERFPLNPFLIAFYEKYAKAFHLTMRRENRRLSDGASEPLRCQEQEQEQERISLSEPGSDEARALTQRSSAVSQQACRLAALLKSEILRNKPDSRIKPAQERKWAITAQKMLYIDSRSAERIDSLIRWVQHDEFWMANVLSMDTLRAKFDQLELKARAKSPKSAACLALPSNYVPASEKIRHELQERSAGVCNEPAGCGSGLFFARQLRRGALDFIVK